MDIDEADRLYRTFHKTNEGAKHKKGLGFGGAGRSDDGPWKKNADAAPSLFVRQGEGLPAPSRVNAEQSTKREREERASRVAQRMAELKERNANKGSGGKQQSQDEDGSDPGTSGRYESQERPVARSTKADLNGSKADPYRGSSSRGREEDGRRERDREGERREGGHDRSRSGSKRDRERSSRVDVEDRGGRDSKRLSERHEDRQGRSRSSWRDREWIDEEDGRDRQHEERHSHSHHRSSSSKGAERCAERSGRQHSESSSWGADRYHKGSDRYHKGSGRRGSSREGRRGGGEEGISGNRLKEQAGVASGKTGKRQDLDRLIPGYSEMTPQEKLQARTRFALAEAERASRKRSRQEEKEDEEVARAEGRESGGGPVRQWTRYNFNPQAPLAQESQAKAGDLGARDVATTAKELGVDKDGETLNPLAPSRNRETEEMRKRDEDHTAAIWGAHAHPFSKDKPQQQQEQLHLEASNLTSTDDDTEGINGGGQEQGQGRAGAQSISDETDALAELARREGWTADDAPVVVMEEEHAAPIADPGSAKACQEAEAVAETIRSQQKGLSWRERANAAKARKSAVAAPPAPAPAPPAPALQLSWRDKAKARGGRAMAASNALE